MGSGSPNCARANYVPDHISSAPAGLLHCCLISRCNRLSAFLRQCIQMTPAETFSIQRLGRTIFAHATFTCFLVLPPITHGRSSTAVRHDFIANRNLTPILECLHQERLRRSRKLTGQHSPDLIKLILLERQRLSIQCDFRSFGVEFEIDERRNFHVQTFWGNRGYPRFVS